jgi:hypothetical protein
MKSFQQFISEAEEWRSVSPQKNADVEALASRLETHHNANRNDTDSHHLNDYSSYSKDLNDYMFGNRGDSGTGHYFRKVVGIRNAMNNSPELPEDVTIYSGLHKKPELNKTYVHHGFMSASLHRDVATQFATDASDDAGSKESHILKMTIPKGSQGMSTYIGDLSEFPSEKEMLIRNGAHIKINGKTSYAGENGTTVHEYHGTLSHPDYE